MTIFDFEGPSARWPLAPVTKRAEIWEASWEKRSETTEMKGGSGKHDSGNSKIENEHGFVLYYP